VPRPRPRLHLIRFHGVLALYFTTSAKLRALVVPAGHEEATGESEHIAAEPVCAHRNPVRISWARPLKRVFEVDMEHCPNCGGELKIIAAILESAVIERILTHLGLQARAPPRAASLPQLRLQSATLKRPRQAPQAGPTLATVRANMAFENPIPRAGAGVRAGTVVTTGTWCGLVAAQADDPIKVSFDGLGEVALRL